MIERKDCAGCRNDFYNSSDLAVGGKCWSRETGKMVRRLKVHISDMPPWKHKAKDYPNCYSASQHVMVKPEDRR